MLKLIRFVSSLLLLCSLIYLVVDLAFYFFLPSQRGEGSYWAAQAVFQMLIGLSLYKGWIVIYTGRDDVNERLPLT